MQKKSLDEIFGSVSTSTQPGVNKPIQPSRPSLGSIFEGVSTSTQAVPQAGQVQAQTKKTGVFSRLASSLEETGRGIGEFGIGFAKEAAALPFKAAQLGSDIGLLAAAAIRPDATYQDLKEAMSSSAINRASQRPVAFTPRGEMQEIGAGAEQFAEFFVPVGGASKARLASKVANKFKEAPKVAKAIDVGTKAISEGVEQFSRAALQEGEIGEEAKTAAALGVATPIVGGAFKSISDKLGNAIFSFTVPSTPGQRAKDFRRSLDVGEAVSRTGVSISKGSLLRKIRSEAQALGTKLDDALSAYDRANPATQLSIDDVTSSVSSKLSDDVLAKEMQISPVDVKTARKAVEDRLDEYKILYKDKPFTVKDLQELKVSMGNALEEVYKKSLDAPLKAKALADVELRSSLKKTIQELVPETEQINKQLAPLLEAEGRMQAKGSYSGYLTDVIVGSMAAGSAGDFLADPVEYSKNFLSGVVAKRLGTSTAAKTLSGTLIKDAGKIMASPQFTQIVRRALELGSQEGDSENIPEEDN